MHPSLICYSSQFFPKPAVPSKALGNTAALGRQSRSNPISGRCLPKTGIFAVFAGDFCRNGLRVRHFGSSETDTELQKPANCGLFFALRGATSVLGTAWLAKQC
jgi:hypothetical protein